MRRCRLIKLKTSPDASAHKRMFLQNNKNNANASKLFNFLFMFYYENGVIQKVVSLLSNMHQFRLQFFLFINRIRKIFLLAITNDVYDYVNEMRNLIFFHKIFTRFFLTTFPRKISKKHTCQRCGKSC